MATPGFLSGKSHGQRSLEGCSPGSHKTVRHDLVTKQRMAPSDWYHQRFELKSSVQTNIFASYNSLKI